MDNTTNTTAAAPAADGRIAKRAGDFRGSSRCYKSRLYDGLKAELPSSKNWNFDRAIVVKDILKGLFTGEYERDEIPELVDEGCGDGYETEETGRLRREELVRCIRRYYDSEDRDPEVDVPAMTVSVGNYDVKVKPDAVYDEGGMVECVLWRAGKPNVKEKGRNRDAGVNTCTELWFLLQYAKSLVPAGETRTIRASYYFMRKDTDRRGFSMMWDDDFFSGNGGNVVSLSDVYIAPEDGKEAQDSDIDRSFKAQIAEYAEGQECTPEECKTCFLNCACNYVKTPEHVEKAEHKKGAKPITLTPAQEEVVSFSKGACRVNAGAGAGKTECVALRVARLIENGASPEEILMITFTDAGAREMRERTAAKCGEEVSPDDIRAMTFNTFAYGIVREHFEELGFPKEPAVIDDVRNAAIITQLLDRDKPAGLDYMNYSADMANCKGALACAVKVFEVIKTKRLDPDAYDTPWKVMQELSPGWSRFMKNGADGLVDLYPEYAKRLKEDALLTFADQEPMMFEALATDPDYLEGLGYKHIIVDEFQDSNDIQMDTIRALTQCSCFESLMVVGDDSQSIYGFRNTSPENILNFWDKLGINGTDLYLVENHRSVPEILDLANRVNALNVNRVEKDLVAARPSQGHSPVVKGFFRKEDEYGWVVAEMKRLMDEEGYLPEDIAFIAAKKVELVAMSTELTRAGIPWVMKNPMPYMENSRVQAALALADAFYQPDASSLYFSYLSALYDGNILDELTEEEIVERTREMKSEFMNMDLLEIPRQRKIFHDYLEAIEGGDEIYRSFLDLLFQCEDLQTELEYAQDFKRFGEKAAKKMEQDYAGVVLTTAHSSKGLEWKAVFNSVTGYDSKQLHSAPGRNSAKLAAEIEERRRLLFVSLTRARDLLYVTGQCIAYKTEDMLPVANRFLEELCSLTNTPFTTVDPEAAKREKERREKAKAKAKERREKAKAKAAGAKPDAPAPKPAKRRRVDDLADAGCFKNCIQTRLNLGA